MRLIELVTWLTCVYSVMGAPNYHRRHGQLNMQRSLRRQWYRNDDSEDTFDCAEDTCRVWDNFFASERGRYLSTQHGILCIIIQGKLKLLTWIGFRNVDSERCHRLVVIPTVVNTRESNIYPCHIIDATVKGRFAIGPDSYEYCDVIMIDRVLWCVDEANMVSGAAILSFYPRKNQFFPHGFCLDYYMCGTMMGNDCIADSIVPSIAEPNEAVEYFLYGSLGP